MGVLPPCWPGPADPDAAARLLDRFAALGAPERQLCARPEAAAMLRCLGGNSPFLSDLALRRPGCLRLLARRGPEAALAAALGALARVRADAPRPEVTRALRVARAEVALLTAASDLGGLWGLDQVTAALSDLAEAALRLATAHALHAASAPGGPLRLPAGPGDPDPCRGSGFTVLAMGKLGARELNYSSDVDLVLLYDPAAHPYHAGGLGEAFARVGRDLVALMERRDADGYVARTDLRLRPDPATTPAVVRLPAALAYYESMGQTWERAAFSKARPVAGDLALGARFLEAIRPFVWRRHLDFAALSDIAEVKRRIDEHRGATAARRAVAVGGGASSARAVPGVAAPGASSGTARGDAATRGGGAGAAARGGTPPGVEPLEEAVPGANPEAVLPKAPPDAPPNGPWAGAGEAPERALLGHDLKLGRGGIREVEFLAQALQLAWGGRDPRLREPATVPALRALAAAGHLPPATAERLAVAYAALRRAEHRLQMVADRQTHALPDTPAGMAAFARFMGMPGDAPADALGDASGGAPGAASGRAPGRAPDDVAGAGGAGPAPDGGRAMAAGLLAHLEAVHAAFAPLAPGPVAPDELDLGPEDAPAPPETLARLRALGFTRPEAAVGAARRWRAGRPRALRSERARGLLRAVLPAVLRALGRQRAPDEALARLDALLERLPAGVQLLSAFRRHPPLLERVAGVLGAAPGLADHLAAAPASLDGLLGREGADPDPAASLRLQLRGGAALPGGGADAALEEALGVAGRFVRGEEFRLSCAQMEGRLDADAAGVARTALADAVLGELLPRVLRAHRVRHGRVHGGAMAVVALGKCGGREMMAGSDLDLLLVYDHPEAVTASTGGARPLPASQYFIRLAHALVAALTAPGREGPLYAVDVRLRPSGNKGPVAVPLSGFRRYHATEAWTWERMALTRARVVAGPPALRRRVQAALREALAGPAAAAPSPEATAPPATVPGAAMDASPGTVPGTHPTGAPGAARAVRPAVAPVASANAAPGAHAPHAGGGRGARRGRVARHGAGGRGGDATSPGA